MKPNRIVKSAAALLFSSIALMTYAQPQDDPRHRFIEVTGEGEVKVDPNIIYLSIELTEYKKDGKIVKLEELEGQLTKVLQTVGIPADNLKVYASSGRQLDLRKTKSDLLIGKRYSLKLTDVDLLNPLLGELGEAKILAVKVTEVTHTDIEKFKAEAKIKAVNNATDKATLLATNLNTKVGKVLRIHETGLIDMYPVQALQGRVAGAQLSRYPDTAFGYDAKGESNNVNFEQIKLTYKIVVRFEIE